MQIKNKIFLLIIYIFSLTVFSISINAEELNISAIEISIDKEKNTIVGKGSVKVIGYGGKIIKADKVIYEKSKEFLLAEGSVEITDPKGYILKTQKASYDKKNEIISSDQDSIFTDAEGNIVTVTMFQYRLKENLFSSVGKIKVKDINNNKYFFKEIHVDTKKKEMIGSSVSAILDQENFGLTKESDPRFVSNDIFMSENKSDFSKGIFTICKERKDKCPPWELRAKKISHNKIKKIIYYENATLRVYGVPIFFFPRFYHPDPTVKRQSGFLSPVFTNTSTTGFGVGVPYYWRMSHDKDLTFTPKTYNNENILYLNEYRQAFRNGFLTLDTSYHKGYKETTSKKTTGSRNHIFAQLDFDFSKIDSYESSLQFKTQRTSNDTYFKVHDINTSLVDSENTNLENEISYNFSKDDMFINVSAAAYENLNEKTNDRYEFITPNILYGKTFFTERFGTVDFKSNAFYKNYDADKHITFFNNDIIWSPGNNVTKNGFVNTVQGILKNQNYEAKNTGGEYKTNGTVNELASVLSYKSSLPMEKTGIYSSKFFSPTFMIKYAPGHMRNLSDDDVNLNYMNLYSINKTSEIENGLSAILGFDFKTMKKNENGDDVDKLSISMGQVFNKEENDDLPSKSSLDQKTSDLVGTIDYNFTDIGKIQYKFALDHNFNDLNYNEVSSNFNFGKIGFNVGYLEEQNHVGNENFITTGVSFNLNDQNTLNLQTKKNFKTDSTEFYDISYQYAIDCLTAGLVYRREFYEDGDIDAEPKDSLMFTIKFIPFTGVKTPSVISP